MSKFSTCQNGLKPSLTCCLFITLLIQGIFSTNFHIKKDRKSGALCPSPKKINPCTCNGDGIRCTGPTVTQNTINQVMTELREVNKVAAHQPLFTDDWTFLISDTSMTTFDLSPLVNSQFHTIFVSANVNLSRIQGPQFNAEEKSSAKNDSLGSTLTSDLVASSLFSIEVIDLYLDNNNLTDEGLVDCFRYFSPSLLRLYLGGNSIRGPKLLNSLNTPNTKKSGISEPREFLPGLWTFVNLQVLDLGRNRIKVLNDAPFKALGALQLLSLGCVEEVGENGLLINDDDSNAPSERFIYLSYDLLEECSLKDDKFHQNHGLQQFRGKTELDLQNNVFEFFSENKFGPFLQINPSNTIKSEGNPFRCDGRMKWLKDGRESYRWRVDGVNCINDPDHTIFTTNLV